MFGRLPRIFCIIYFLAISTFVQIEVAYTDEGIIGLDTDIPVSVTLLTCADNKKSTQARKSGNEKGSKILAQSNQKQNNVGYGNPFLKNIENKLKAFDFNISCGFEVLDDNRTIFSDFSHILKKVSFYTVQIHSSIPYKKITVAVNKDHNVFIMPQEINSIISDGFNAELNKSKTFQLANLYVILSAAPPHYYKLIESAAEIPVSKNLGVSPFKYAKFIKGPVIEEQADYYTVRFFVWNNIGGNLEDWSLSITNSGKVKEIDKLIIGRNVGDFEVLQ